MATTLDFLRRLNEHGVEFVIVGGLAGVLHGSRFVTEDVDVCTPMTQENLARIVTALADLHPRHRMNPNQPPLSESPEALARFSNLYLLTDWGQIDFRSEISGVGDYVRVAHESVTAELKGITCRVLSLDALLRSKRALGRPKDVQVAVELEAIREQQDK